ncbi:MAG TPA: SDR family NAD(P)-dependent oxidoreductase, partial [Streptosporangiaceae bacterium]
MSELAAAKSGPGSASADGFAGRVAIVTGGGSGIGAALVRALADRGAAVVIADIDETAAKSVADGVAASGGDVRAVVLDVRDAGAVSDLVNNVAAERGGLDFIFNNAGI